MAPTYKIITKEEAEKVARSLVRKKNAEIGGRNFKLVEVGEFNELYSKSLDTEFYNTNGYPFLFRVDGVRWEKDLGDFSPFDTSTKIQMIKRNNALWWYLVDFSKRSFKKKKYHQRKKRKHGMTRRRL